MESKYLKMYSCPVSYLRYLVRPIWPYRNRNRSHVCFSFIDYPVYTLRNALFTLFREFISVISQSHSCYKTILLRSLYTLLITWQTNVQHLLLLLLLLLANDFLNMFHDIYAHIALAFTPLSSNV